MSDNFVVGKADVYEASLGLAIALNVDSLKVDKSLISVIHDNEIGTISIEEVQENPHLLLETFAEALKKDKADIDEKILGMFTFDEVNIIKLYDESCVIEDVSMALFVASVLAAYRKAEAEIENLKMSTDLYGTTFNIRIAEKHEPMCFKYEQGIGSVIVIN